MSPRTDPALPGDLTGLPNEDPGLPRWRRSGLVEMPRRPRGLPERTIPNNSSSSSSRDSGASPRNIDSGSRIAERACNKPAAATSFSASASGLELCLRGDRMGEPERPGAKFSGDNGAIVGPSGHASSANASTRSLSRAEMVNGSVPSNVPPVTSAPYGSPPGSRSRASSERGTV